MDNSPVDIRKRAKEILGKSKDILGIDWEAVDRRLIPRIRDMEIDPYETKYWGDLNRELGLALFFNVVNFCFKNPVSRVEYKYVDMDGNIFPRSRGLAQAMRNAYVDWGNLYEVIAITPEAWEEITQIGEKNRLYLATGPTGRMSRIVTFAINLAVLGYEKVEEVAGDKGKSAQDLLRFLSGSGFFEDEFLKRAQLTVANWDRILKAKSMEGIEGVDSLTCFADYRIPQVFYNSGVVILNPVLSERLIREELISSGSREERALRASVIAVGEYMAKETGLTEAEVDHKLWELSQQMTKNEEMFIPHMLVATDKY